MNEDLKERVYNAMVGMNSPYYFSNELEKLLGARDIRNALDELVAEGRIEVDAYPPDFVRLYRVAE
jgi:hypothetical protein